MSKTLTILDLLIIFAYLISALAIGIYKGKNISSVREYAIGDKKFSPIILMATIFATLVGGSTTLGVPQRIFSIGIVMLLSIFGFAIGNLVIGYFIAPKIDKFKNKISIGEIIENDYGKSGRMTIGLFGFIYCTGLIGIQTGAMGHIFNLFIGIPYTWGVIIGCGIVIIYSAFGGIRSVAFTDAFQFTMIIITIPILAAEGLRHAGMWEGLFSFIKQEYPTHINPLLNIELIKKYVPLFFTFSIPFLFPSVVQRLLMAKKGSQAKKAFISTAIIEFFFFPTLAIIGLTALKLNPNLNSNLAFPYLLQATLPTVLKGFAIAGIFSVIMSSADSFLNGGSISLIHDFIKPLYGKKLSAKGELKLIRITSVIIGLAAILISMNFNNLMKISIVATIFWVSTVTPAVIGTLLGYKRKKIRFFGATLGGLSCIVIWKNLVPSKYGIDALLPAILTNAFIFFGPKVILSLALSPIRIFLKCLPSRKWMNQFLVIKKSSLIKLKKFQPFFPNIVSYYNKVTEEHGDMGVLFGFFMTINIIIPYFMWGLESIHNSTWITLRLASGICCAILIFKKKWTVNMLKYWGLFYHIALIVSLPLLGTFAIFDTKGSLYALLNTSISLLMLVLLTDWKNFLFILITGSLFGWGIFEIVNMQNPLVTPFHITQTNWHTFLYTSTFTLIVGLLFSQKRNARQKYLLQ